MVETDLRFDAVEKRKAALITELMRVHSGIQSLVLPLRLEVLEIPELMFSFELRHLACGGTITSTLCVQFCENEWLDLGCNAVTSKGVTFVTTHLESNKRLKFIGFAQNPFDMSGINSFLHMLQSNDTLMHCWHLSSTIIPVHCIVAAFQSVRLLQS